MASLRRNGISNRNGAAAAAVYSLCVCVESVARHKLASSIIRDLTRAVRRPIDAHTRVANSSHLNPWDCPPDWLSVTRHPLYPSRVWRPLVHLSAPPPADTSSEINRRSNDTTATHPAAASKNPKKEKSSWCEMLKNCLMCYSIKMFLEKFGKKWQKCYKTQAW